MLHSIKLFSSFLDNEFLKDKESELITSVISVPNFVPGM